MAGNDSVIEIPKAVPDTVRLFAQQLIEHRRLPVPIEVLEIPAAAPDIAATIQQNMGHLSDVDGFTPFTTWAAVWVKSFGERTNANAISLYLLHARQPTCPRFHIDNVALRLISTLTGPGSEWLHPKDVGRMADGSINQAPDAAVIRQMAPASVGLFKGGSRNGGGVVHRSPPATADRVVMKIDIAARQTSPNHAVVKR